jgi:hypothetical protein
VQDTEENCSAVQNSPAGGTFGQMRRSSTGCTPPDYKSRAVVSGVFMRQPDLAATGTMAEAGTPSLWPGRKAQVPDMSTTEEPLKPKSACLGMKDMIQSGASNQAGLDVALNPFSMFCGTRTCSDAGVVVVPSPVKAKITRNLFGPDS